MVEWSANRFRRLWLLLMVVLIGCVAPSAPTGTTPAPEVELAEPTEIAPVASLTTVETTVQRIRGNSAVEVAKDQQAEIVENDQIALAEQGHGLLRFEDDLVVELFRNTQVEVSDAKLDPQGFLFLGLRQIAGSTRAELNAERDARLHIQTELAEATVSTAGGEDAELVVCHKPETVTCLVTVRGTVEVASAGKTVEVPAGEGVYVFADIPLSDPICVVQEEFETWLANERNARENPGLGAVVRGWPQLGCEELAAATPVPTEMPLPAGQGMVRVEGGLYEVGHQQADAYHIAARQIEVDSFWIDAYEVTNGQYAVFVEATGHAAPPGWPFGSERINHPAQGVTWHDAVAYCTWSTKRLPAEAEWEIAGRGPGDPPPLYPWGDDPFAGGQIDQLSRTDTHPVGSASFNASHVGAYDLVGNVWEWVGEPYAPVPEGSQVLRGGRHGLYRDLAYREVAAPAAPSFLPYAGFRCAASQVAGE